MEENKPIDGAEYISLEDAKRLKLPHAFIPLCTIVIGHPAEQPQPKDKWKPENVSYNEYGGKAE